MRDIERILNIDLYSDEYKIKKIKNVLNFNFKDISGDELYNLIVYEFKTWRSNNIKSSNVRRIVYNDETKEMVVQFHQDKVIYTYYNVPFQTFLDVSGGKATCITDGENRWGKWFVGKTPSTGAALNKYLIKKGITYKKGGSFK